MAELAMRVKKWDIGGESTLPLPGAGRTAARHRALMQLGRQDLSLARIAEAHNDALAILNEAGRSPRAGELYGVWASDGPQSGLVATPLAQGRWRLEGTKQFCSGATFVTTALVTARAHEGVRLFAVPIDQPRIRVLPSNWATPALEDTATGPVSFDEVILNSDAQIGDAGWYLDRPGFWHGAIGPAACWAGGAQALIDAAAALNRNDPHSRAHRGALQAISWGLTAVLDHAGREIDEDPNDQHRAARVRALKLRHLVERWCTEVLDRFGRATGPQLLCFDPQAARQHLALSVYIRQCHGERDLETI